MPEDTIHIYPELGLTDEQQQAVDSVWDAFQELWSKCKKLQKVLTESDNETRCPFDIKLVSSMEPPKKVTSGDLAEVLLIHPMHAELVATLRIPRRSRKCLKQTDSQ